ncbi:putative aryl-alcohol dehydrogenase [Aspergillus violaceofuscus CBS 115571]|uniref:Putative aryl-alcohol dehydrogenase n=1 Tax=Aspergillus violaceofuscus (strain CBS 115571) TaxID=1450538 RepID=A0A2V5HVV2_ASPV1|nr:putative aryl-alcohol dehydrogenase [Aspergillus violaceofuscus CBS 115571]
MPVYNTDSTEGLRNAIFDFIIIGGGTAGLVAANRLTERSDIRVLVLEAGTNRLGDPRTQIPALGPTTYADQDFDWDLPTLPQEQLHNRCLFGTKGRTLGGSSVINQGLVVYPSQAGMNTWEQLGNPGWGWDDFAPYLRKFETAFGPSESVRDYFPGMQYDPEAHGQSGPLQVPFASQYMPVHAACWQGFREMGYPASADPINGRGLGPFVAAGAVDPAQHTRSHAGAAYLPDSVQRRPNLRVVTGIQVDRLGLEQDESTKIVRAMAVEVSHDNQTYQIRFKNEVILAAGAVQTPQLLELSGIGDGPLLRAHGINPIIRNPGVGENLQDHGIVSFGYEVADGVSSFDEMAHNPNAAAAAMAAYQQDGSGPLGMVPYICANMPCVDLQPTERDNLLGKIDGASGPSPKQAQVLRELLQDPDEPTSQYTLLPFQLDPRQGSKGIKALMSPAHPRNFITLVSTLCYPLSRGSVHIRSSNPRHHPALDHGILRHPVDLELHARHAMWMEQLAATPPMTAVLKENGVRLHSPEPITDLEHAKKVTKELLLSTFHLAGTCAMTPREDGGVVDPRLCVYGTTNVRVVDASIFPLVPRGDIQATVFAVAEKAADLIKEDLDGKQDKI